MHFLFWLNKLEKFLLVKKKRTRWFFNCIALFIVSLGRTLLLLVVF